MKIILSRKGFDSSYGGGASPIMPNGDLLSTTKAYIFPGGRQYLWFVDTLVGEGHAPVQG